MSVCKFVLDFVQENHLWYWLIFQNIEEFQERSWDWW